ncbi:hypothetical protein PENSOL_c004G10775 [Penicillium solitum]|uniref:Uncharacterized protein n=1 Tax=Penicillium solitum TaxID=60172 RepID=A0A1V6RIT4_9EURO|nr:uncharacterized protein PENSOL_c004G10775 [Penicillium solitum]OQE01359.1 hypothetical protein PENSOL_c004G10775 [Penicillium solitum]
MNKLPPEILALIFAEIWDLYPESLRGLNTVNRVFYDTAARFLYKTLTIQFYNNREYEQAVTNVLTRPTNANWYKHTRRLDIICGKTGLPLSSNYDMAMGEIPFPEDNPYFGPVVERLAERNVFATPKWELLVSLLGKIQHLVELNYAVVDMFPQALLEALHQHHPACKLNIHAFTLTNLMSLDACEMDLIQSPCLHGIRFSPWIKSKNTGPETYTETIYRIMSIAPNLKHFYVDINESHYPLSKAIPKGKGLDSPVTTFKMGKLKSLSLRFRQEKRQILHEASRHTDFSELQSLDLDSVIGDDIPIAIASTYSFRNLQNLSVTIDNSLSEGLAELMFESINPLAYLKIQSHLGPSIIEKILMRHGPTLQGLVLLPGPYSRSLTEAPKGGCSTQVLRYAKLCPRLRNLHIETRRTAGSEDEIRLYEAYGQFPSLEFLALDMECAIPYEQSNDPKRFEMSAVAEIAFSLILDPALCLAIWDRISSTQKSGRLRKLELCPQTRRSLPSGRSDPQVFNTAFSLKRSYLVRRRIFDKQELPIIIEIDAESHLPLNFPNKPLRRPLWFEALPQVDFAFGTVERPMYPLYSKWRSEWLTRPLQRLAVDLLTKRRKRTREAGDSERETKHPRTIAQ